MAGPEPGAESAGNSGGLSGSGGGYRQFRAAGSAAQGPGEGEAALLGQGEVNTRKVQVCVDWEGRFCHVSESVPGPTDDITLLSTWIQALDGNTSDSRAFPSLVEAYLGRLREGKIPYLVADSALYSAEHLQRLAGVKWLTRVPERIRAAKRLIAEVEAEEKQPTSREGYRYLELCTTYGGVRQRWLVVWSARAEKGERARLQKRVEKERGQAEKA